MTFQPRLPLRKARAPRNNAEDRLQMAVVKHLHQRGHKGWLFFHVPNGGKMSSATRRRLAAMGVLPGIPDIVLIAPSYGYAYGLELKVRGNKPTANQIIVGMAWEATGAPYAVATGMDEALAILEAWGALKTDRSLVRRSPSGPAPSLFEGEGRGA